MSANERIKQVRLAVGMSQAKFAKEIAISNGYVAGIELGRRKVNARLIMLVSFAFKVNENWLRTGEGEMFNEHRDIMLDEIVRIFMLLRPEYKDYALKQIHETLMLQEALERVESNRTLYK